MAITANLLPTQWPDFTLPIDGSLQFASAQTIVATGYLNNVNPQVWVGTGRFDGVLAVNISAFSILGAGIFSLLGSNDPAFGSGNVVNLTSFDIPVIVADAIVPTISGVFPTIPPAGRGGWLRAQPFTNYIGGGYVMQYLKLYLQFVSTGSITLSAWLVPARIA